MAYPVSSQGRPELTGKWWETIDTLKYCYYCGNYVHHGHGWSTVGMCIEHEKIWSEDIASGFKQNRLRQIMIDRGEI